MYVCLCHAVTDSAIKEALNKGANSVEDLKNELNVSTRCGCCRNEVDNMVKEHHSKHTDSPAIWLPVGGARLCIPATG